MPKASPALSAFNSGELSPLIEGRTDDDFSPTYRSGCKRLENFICTVQGAAMRRGGERFVAETKDSSDRSWLIPFVFNKSQAFVLEFGDQYIRFYRDRGVLLDSGSPYEISTPYLIADLTAADGSCALSFVQSGDVLYLTLAGYPPKKLSRVGNTNWTLTDYSPSNGPFKELNIDKAITVTGVTYNATITGAANNGSGLIRLTVGSTTGLTTGQTVRVALVTGTTEANGFWTVTVVDGTKIDLQGSTFTNAYSSGGEIRVRGDVGNTVTLTASSAIFEAGHADSLFYLELSDFSDSPPWEVAKPISFTQRRRSDGKTYEAASTGVTGSSKPIHTEGQQYDGFDDTSTVGTTEGVLWQYNDSGSGVIRITSVSSSTVVVGEITQAIPYEFTISSKPTYRWAHSAWSDVEGYPTKVAFFRERLFFAKSYTIYGSVAGDFENMAAKEQGEVLADSAIIFPVLSDQVNEVQWMTPTQGGLLVGTEGAEFVVGSSSNGEPFGATNIDIDPQTGFGSRGVTPVRVANSILFVQRSGRKLYETTYNNTFESYEANDCTVIAEHITRTGIVDMAYQQDPYTMVWVALADGGLRGLTLQAGQRVKAWQKHPLGGNGKAESVVSIPSPDGNRDDVWLIVKRTINGSTKRYVGYLNKEHEVGDDIKDAFYLDCGLTYEGVAATTISGLSHLEGETVDILADGATHPQRTVSSGSVTLQRAASKVQIGYACPAVLQTMRINAGAADGTAQGKTKRITKANFRFYETVGAKIGADENNLDEIQFRSPSNAMDTALQPFTGDKLEAWPNGYDVDGYIMVKQDKPLPMTVVAIHPQVDTQDR